MQNGEKEKTKFLFLLEICLVKEGEGTAGRGDSLCIAEGDE